MTSASAFWDTTNGQIKYKPEGKLINVEEANLDAMSRFILFVENKCIASLVNRNRDEFMILARYMLYSKTHSTLINKAFRSHHNEVECERKMLDIRCRKNQFGKCKIFVCTISRLTACYNCVKRTIWECQAYRKEFAKVFTKKTFQTIEWLWFENRIALCWILMIFSDISEILMGFNCLQLNFWFNFWLDPVIPRLFLVANLCFFTVWWLKNDMY